MATTAGMVGANPADLEALARELRSAAEHIEQVCARIGGRLQHTSWQGHDAERARHDWRHRHAGHLGGAAAGLRAQADVLTAEAAGQRDASADTGAVCTPPGGTTSWPIDVLSGLETGIGVIGAVALFTNNANAIGRYSKSWSKAIDVFGDIARYKRSPVLQHLADLPGHDKLKFLDDKLGPVGKAFDVVSAFRNGYQIGDRLAHGDYVAAAQHAGHAAADVLKASGNPVAYLTGVNVEVWTQVTEEFQKVDWQQGIPNPLTPGNLENVWIPAMKDTGKELVSRLEAIFG